MARPIYANTVMYAARAKEAADAADLNFESLKVEARVLCRFEIL